MATKTFASLAPTISQYVVGCPQRTIIDMTRRAAIELCANTLAWRHAEDTYPLLPGVHEYAFNKPTNADVHVVFDAIVNNVPLAKLTLEQALCAYPEWADLYSGEDASELWSLTPSSLFGSDEYNASLFAEGSLYQLPDSIVANASQPRVICQLTPEKYIILPLPDNARTYTMRMFYALKPRVDATGMDQAVLDDLSEAITAKTISDLMLMPNTSWYNTSLSNVFARKAFAKQSERRARANLANARGSLRVVAPKFA